MMQFRSLFYVCMLRHGGRKTLKVFSLQNYATMLRQEEETLYGQRKHCNSPHIIISNLSQSALGSISYPVKRACVLCSELRLQKDLVIQHRPKAARNTLCS